MAGVNPLSEDSYSTLEQEVRGLSEVSLRNPPGKVFEYSNANYLILGLVIETVTDQGYNGYVKTELFAPLQMRGSYLSKEEGETAGMSAGHIKWLRIPVVADVQYLENSLAAGFIISNAEDMCRYLLLHLGEGSYRDKSLLSKAGIKELYKPGRTQNGSSDYAMGLIVNPDDRATTLYHDGATQGFNAGMAFSPEEQWGVIVLTNMSSMIELPAGTIALRVSEFLRELLRR